MQNETTFEDQVILVAYTGCIYLEAAHAISILSTASRIVVATPDGKPARVGEGWTINGDCSFTDAIGLNAKCIVVPGGDIFARLILLLFFGSCFSYLIQQILRA